MQVSAALVQDAARIGPNAIIQLGETFAARAMLDEAAAIYAKADCPQLLGNPPQVMVDEAIVARLFKAVIEELSPAMARDILTEAGRRTGDYILANRIPAPARLILPLLPRRLAKRILLAAIGKHAWTFAGSGRFSYTGGTPTIVSIGHNPVAIALGCVWHEAVFTRLFSALLSSPATVREDQCCGHGAEACTFRIE